MRRWLVLVASCLAVASAGSCGSTVQDDDDDISPDGDADSDTDADSDGDADGDCTDLDGDGAGVGDGCTADDCDDTDPGTISQCGDGCDANPLRAGCPCEAGTVVACYMGPEDTAGRGVCAAGLKECANGGWGPCDGQVLPTVPVETECNYLDDNCDGAVDEGVQSVCGDCNLECQEQCIGVECDEAFDPALGRSVILNPDGSLTLSGAAAVTNFVIWVANTGEGTVSKINTRTREEEGRYITMPTDLASGWAASPSRTTVNPHGDVVVSNREGVHGGSTKILASDCPDQDHDGIVETSTGAGDVLPWDEDECAVWYCDDIPFARGSAFEVRSELDGGIHEYVWVGSYDYMNPAQHSTVFEIDSLTGEKTGVELPDTPAYGLAMGPGGILWSVGLSGCPISTDTTTLEQTRWEGCGGAYGIAVDADGRCWIGSSVSRLDPVTETWEYPVDENGNRLNVYGGGITVDSFGNAYTGEYDNWGGGSQAYKIDGETLEATLLPGMGGHGWAVDFDGFIWSVDMQDSAHVMDPETLEVEDVRPPFVSPYTYSDMTGFQLQNTVTPAGIYERLFETCDDTTQLHLAQLEWDAVVPAGSAISFRLKHAPTIPELDGAPWIDVASIPSDTSPVDLDAVLTEAGVDVDTVGRFVSVEATLQSIDRLNRPVLSSFALRYSCFDPFG